MYRRYLQTLSLLLLLSAVMTGCGLVVDGESSDARYDLLSRFNADGKAWLSLQISLSDSPAMTRANDFVDSFEDATGAEKTVSDATIVLLKKTSGQTEDEAKVASSYTITSPGFQSTTDPQVEYKLVQQIDRDNLDLGDEVYILVLLNAPALTLVNNSTTFADIKAMTSAGQSSSGFLMSNAPLATKPGGNDDPSSGDIEILVLLDPAYVFPSEEQAIEEPASRIFVERAVAKVEAANNVSTLYVLGNEHVLFTKDDFTYCLDSYNTSTHVVRNFNTAWLSYQASSSTSYRMVEGQQIAGDSHRYRTYWTQDVNYSSSTGLIQAEATDFKALTSFTPAYVCENTFDVGHQSLDCTTSLLVRLQLNAGKHFYTITSTGSDRVYSDPVNLLTEEGTSGSESFAPRRSPAVAAEWIPEISYYLRQWLMQNDDVRSWVNQYALGKPDYLTIEMNASTYNATTGTIQVTVGQRACTSGTGETSFDDLGLTARINNALTIYKYVDGYCYYRVPIRHFSDAETPWLSAVTMADSSVDAVYGTDTDTREKNYLGRYGLLRNHWYTISVESVRHIGYPTLAATRSTTADDAADELVGLTLSVSSWNSHAQSEEY